MNPGDRAKLHKYLPKSIDRIAEAIDSPNERIAVGAARFVIEQCIGKAPQFLDEETKAKGAAELAAALQDALENRRGEQSAIEAPTIEGTVRILGTPPEPDHERLSEEALAGIDDF